MSDTTGPIAALAVIDALLVAMFFLFRTLPWARPGPWRRIWLLASLAAVLFIFAEVAAVFDPQQPVGAIGHQLPLFGVILAATAGFLSTYLESRRALERERILAAADPLTGLSNRQALQERIAVALEGNKRFAVLWIDLDGFHLVNDLLGSETGDAVLKEVGQVLARVGRSADLAARVGEDAFALFLSAAEEQGVRIVAEHAAVALATLAASLPTGTRLSGSFGATSQADGRTAHQALELAESAARRASVAGGGYLAYAREAVLIRVTRLATDRAARVVGLAS